MSEFWNTIRAGLGLPEKKKKPHKSRGEQIWEREVAEAVAREERKKKQRKRERSVKVTINGEDVTEQYVDDDGNVKLDGQTFSTDGIFDSIDRMMERFGDDLDRGMEALDRGMDRLDESMDRVSGIDLEGYLAKHGETLQRIVERDKQRAEGHRRNASGRKARKRSVKRRSGRDSTEHYDGSAE